MHTYTHTCCCPDNEEVSLKSSVNAPRISQGDWRLGTGQGLLGSVQSVVSSPDACCRLCLQLQGYGLTETCAASCIAVPDDYALHGTNGPVTPCTEIMLESVPGKQEAGGDHSSLCAVQTAQQGGVLC